MRRWVARTALRERGRMFAVRFDQPHTFLRLPQLSWADRWRLTRVIIGLMVRPGPGPFDLESLAANDNGESMEAWSRRVLGDRVHEYVVRPLMEPLTGADLGSISRSFLVALLRSPHKTRLTVPIEGLDRITTWQLRDVDVQVGVRAEAVKRSDTGLEVLTSAGLIHADAVIVATDAFTAADLCADVISDAGVQALHDVQAIALHHVAFGFRKDPFPDSPYDLVVPVGLGRHTDIGVLLGERRRQRSTPHGGQIVSVYFDGPRSSELAEEDLVGEAQRVLEQAYGSAEPDLVQVFYRPYGLSTAAPGHYRRMLNLLAELPRDVRLAGDYLTYSGIEGAYIAGEQAAHDVLAALGSTIG